MRIMSINCTRNTCATLAPRRLARRVVLAGAFPHGANLAEQFRRHGWEVLTVSPEHDVHAAAAEASPHAVILPEDAGDESGYLACAKLQLTRPELKVVVVGSERTPERERLAEFVGAVFATPTDGACELVKAVAV